ncbi:MAG: hypothetical protein J0I42_14835 [Bosea sp.]|nr:hypothetical protein [Bosea sp. (in: a-proteobacteria)]MBN9453221.1 hypothetical protein [Bosea sp. (in: a-proteobacteria)]
MIRRVFVPAPTPAWRFDSVGDVFATVVLFSLILLVGFGSCWEHLP